MFFDTERIRLLEDIVRATTGTNVFDKHHLQQLAASVQLQRSPPVVSDADQQGPMEESESEEEGFTINPVSPSTAVYSGELSNSNFSKRVQQVIGPDSRARQDAHDLPTPATVSGPRALPLHSEAFTVNEAAQALPPLEVSDFLLDVFFDIGQTNYSYVDERSLRKRLQDYRANPAQLRIEDAPWVCTALIISAVGTQFAHLCKPVPASGIGLDDREHSADDAVALTFYRSATRLIPDAIAMASIESVQAFILLGIYTLPVDAAGLSCTYFGIATKIAIHNGMHRRYHKSLDTRAIEMRKRLWWTTYALERRTNILHGRPVSISKAEVDVELPADIPELRPPGRVDNFHNVMAMMKLVDFLEDAKELLYSFKRSNRSQRPGVLDSLHRLKDDLHRYWGTLPTDIYCRDLDPSKPLFRFNIHLALIYHWVQVYLGRSFIFYRPSAASTSPNQLDATHTPTTAFVESRDSLVEQCIHSALTIIDLCQHLHDHIGLGRASYTEFTSCSAALVAVLARQIHTKTTTYLANCGKGVKLMKKMSVGLYSDTSEKLAVETLELAVHRLDRGINSRIIVNANPSAYERFRNWATINHGEPTSATPMNQPVWSPGAAMPTPLTSGEQGVVGVGPAAESFTTYPDFFPYELGELATLPGLDQWFEYGLH